MVKNKQSMVNLAKIARFGYIIKGTNPLQTIGEYLTSIGDINSDGYPDFVVSTGSDSLETIQVIYGSDQRFTSYNLLNNSYTSFSIVTPFSCAIDSITGLGDINDDNIDDIIISTEAFFSSGNPIAYIIFGNKHFYTGILNLTNMEPAQGFIINGLASTDETYRNYLVASFVGDLNNDAINDIGIASQYSNGQGSIPNGTVYIYFGSHTFNFQTNLTNFNSQDGILMTSDNVRNTLGSSCIGGFDFNKDGIDDVLVGSGPYSNSVDTATYIVFGQNDFPYILNLDNLNGTNGLKINSTNSQGSSDFSLVGSRVTVLNNINGDNEVSVALAVRYQNYTFGYIIIPSGVEYNYINLSNTSMYNYFFFNQTRNLLQIADLTKDTIPDLLTVAYSDKTYATTQIFFGGNFINKAIYNAEDSNILFSSSAYLGNNLGNLENPNVTLNEFIIGCPSCSSYGIMDSGVVVAIYGDELMNYINNQTELFA